MLNTVLIEILERDLDKLKTELNAYNNEAAIWKVEKGISNSSGNLCLHLIGNLNHFVGTILGNTGYVRNRDSEFSLKNIPRSQMIADIDKTKTVIRNTFSKMAQADFEKTYPLKIQDKDVSTMFFMVNLVTHFNYHLGQVNYHRRLIG